jgi:hypothetical protein
MPLHVQAHLAQRAEVHLHQHGDDHHPNQQAHRQVDLRHLHSPNSLEHAGQHLPQRNARHDAQEHPHRQVTLEHAHGGTGGQIGRRFTLRRSSGIPCFDALRCEPVVLAASRVSPSWSRDQAVPDSTKPAHQPCRARPGNSFRSGDSSKLVHGAKVGAVHELAAIRDAAPAGPHASAPSGGTTGLKARCANCSASTPAANPRPARPAPAA